MTIHELKMFPLPNPRPAKAHPEHRQKRKEFEKENPHFNMTWNFGMKAGVVALMAALACFPWEKEYDKHVEEHHPERLQKNKRGSRDRDNGERRRSNAQAGGQRGSRDYRRSGDRYLEEYDYVDRRAVDRRRR
jgi:hypothetical protein